MWDKQTIFHGLFSWEFFWKLCVQMAGTNLISDMTTSNLTNKDRDYRGIMKPVSQAFLIKFTSNFLHQNDNICCSNQA